jgi:hypothetical protein
MFLSVSVERDQDCMTETRDEYIYLLIYLKTETLT